MKTFFLFVAGVFASLTTAAAQPVIKAGGVVNAASYQPGIAPGSIFVVFGSGMGPASLVQASSLPLQTSLSGTSISFAPAATGLSTGQQSAVTPIAALMVYTSAGQVAALLPSSAAPGSYNVSLTYNSQTSAAVQVTVVKRNLGIVTADASGGGQAQSTYGGFDLNRLTKGTLAFAGHNWQLRPGVNGDELILWGTGTGADSKFNDADGSGSTTNVKDLFTVTVGGVTVQPDYVGRSPGAPGLDQVNFKLPANVAKSCFDDVVVSWSDPSFSNHVSIAVANPGDTACQYPGVTVDQMHKLDTGGFLSIGEVALTKTSSEFSVPVVGTSTITNESASASFSKYTGGTIGSANFSLTQPGSCFFIHRTGSIQEVLTGTPPIPLDAGPQLTLNGPNASSVAIPMVSTGIYDKSLYSKVEGIGGTTSGSPTLVDGSYTFAGPGGANVGAFSISEPFPGTFTPDLASIPDPISRGQNLTVTWTGGGTGLVIISGFALNQSGGDISNPIYTSDGFVCVGQASASSFTIPSSVLGQMSQTANDITTGHFGLLSVFSAPNPPVKFTAPGLDLGFATYLVGSAASRGYN